MPLLLRITRQVIDAMGYLHSHDPAVLHLDMKADNILINNNLDAKVTTQYSLDNLHSEM